MSGDRALRAFNALSNTAAEQWLLECCASKHWAASVAAQRPFANVDTLLACAAQGWSKVSDADRQEAFAAHPLIGDVELLRARFSDAEDRANAEQGQVLGAQEAVLEALATDNAAYHARHGFIFIVCASGKSAAQMLALLQERLPRTTEQELQTAAAEQLKITQLRLRAKLEVSM